MTGREETAVELFARTFLELHAFSLITALVVAKNTGLLAGIIAYLVAVHILAATVYIFDLRKGLTRTLVNRSIEKS